MFDFVETDPRNRPAKFTPLGHILGHIKAVYDMPRYADD